MSKPIKIRKLTCHNKLARMFHIGQGYYEIVISERDEYGAIVRQKTIDGDCKRHAITQFKLWTRYHYPTPKQAEERRRAIECGELSV
jgi:hypothetical protein